MDYEFNPKQQEAFEAITSGEYIFVLYGGAAGGGKTFLGLFTLLVLCSAFKGSRWMVIRKDTARIRKSTIPSFLSLNPSGALKRSPELKYVHPNGSEILFLGENYDRDKELNWMKGVEMNGALFEEINECQEATYQMAIQRTGRWDTIKVGGKENPKKIIIATCNPSQGWVKKMFYTPWKNGTLDPHYKYIPAKVTDNPKLDPHHVESLKMLPKYEYMVNVLGDWDVVLKDGGEFFKDFEVDKHVAPTSLDYTKDVHVSIDSNVYPYIAVTLWQVEKTERGYRIMQVDELPCVDPDNTATAAGKKVAKHLERAGLIGKVYIHGDPTTKSRNNIDENKKTFLDKFLEEIAQKHRVQDYMMRAAPPVAATGDFINAIYSQNWEGLEIVIGEHCTTSINDYIETKQDRDGGVLKKRVTDPKTGVSYEPNGHLCVTGETLIQTINGKVRIDEINDGDYVLTRKGYRRVIEWQYNGVCEVKTYEIGGKKISATENHPVFTYSKGFVPISLPTLCDTFCIFAENKSQWKKKLLPITERNSTDTQTQKTEQKEYITTEGLQLWVSAKKYATTFISTLQRSAIYLMAFASIILTRTLSIMISQTLSAYAEGSTQGIIQIKNGERNLQGKTLKSLGLRLLNGTNRLLELSGIEKTLKNAASEIKNTAALIAMCAATSLLKKHTTKGFAVTIANQLLEGAQALTTSDLYAQCVEKVTKQISTQKENTAQGIARKEKVYNLMVEGCNEYFANDVLLHNCDTSRYFLVGWFNQEYKRFLNRYTTAASFSTPKPNDYRW